MPLSDILLLISCGLQAAVHQVFCQYHLVNDVITIKDFNNRHQADFI